MALVAEKEKREMKLRVPQGARLARFLLSPLGKGLLISAALVTVLCVSAFTYYYSKYSRLIDQKLRQGPFANTSKIFAAPRTLNVGDAISVEEVAAELRRNGYSLSERNPMGCYRERADGIEIYPGPDSYFRRDAGLLKIRNGKIARIISLSDNSELYQYQLEPQLITNLFDRNREKRRLVKFEDIPQVLVDAVTSAEDKRFFRHSGIDPLGVIRAAYVDLKKGRKDQGASTLTQQLARSFWLDNVKTWKRKIPEVLITIELEQKLSKKEIFEDYCNQMYLGRRGSFSIQGFGEAAQAYFGKDIRQLNLPEAATLAAMLRNANIYNPFRFPDRARDRRNWVLGQMRENGHISDREYALAVETPLNLVKNLSQSLDAPYFVDLVNETLLSKFQDYDFLSHSFKVYTTLDLNLQRAAAEAVRIGMQQVDERLKRQKRFKGVQFPEAQVALIALDPHTGEIKALVGGRNYGISQLNHVLAKRQPGSSFKPFVYAAALDTAIEGGPTILTASTTVTDEPTTFWFDNKPYEPDNFEHRFYGQVTLRQALAHSMNVATVKVAEMIGYDKVVEMANRAGLNENIQATPAVALGSYEVMPIEIAGAYTIFANEGVYVKPSFISMVRSEGGEPIYVNKIEKHQTLDPRVAYLMTSLMEEVLRSGSGAGVRGRNGFNAPAAGKTGTSHDGWFAGYTSELLCIVWVGFDDNRQLDLQGAHSAAPIWGEFMKRALAYPEYADAKPFRVPDGIVTIQIDPASGMPATPMCPETHAEVFIAGTQPVGSCPLHGGGHPNVTNVAGWDNARPVEPVPANTTPRIIGGEPPVTAQRRSPAAAQPGVAQAEKQAEKPQEKSKEEKKGFFRRLWGVFK
jgi:penicillin-binding protein 1B